VRILQLVSCRGWSSDAYWAARTTRELQRRGHTVTLACLAGNDSRVLDGMRRESVEPVTTLAFASGVHPGQDGRDLVRLRGLLDGADVVHVHRGKEHWLAAVANRLMGRPRPLVRTRHIALAVRPHAANRWLYRRATALVVTVTEAIRGQLVASGLMDGDRVVTLHGGADAERYRPLPRDPEMHRHLGGRPGQPLVGMVAGLRVMKGHAIVIDAAARLAALGIRPQIAFVGRGNVEKMVRDTIERAGLAAQFSIVGFVDDLPAVLAALDVALYVPLESDGMSRVVFESLAAGRPLVASRVGVVPEVLADGRHAALVPAGDAEALAVALGSLVSDSAQRERLGESGRRLIDERYSGARVAAALESCYARLVTAGAA
jgi:glycosyltransferase involved in cell wall biosynthesis